MARRRRKRRGGRHQPRPPDNRRLVTELAVRPEFYVAFREQFEAALELDAFSMDNRPPPPQEPIGRLMFRIYARATKTYRGALRLTGAGYAMQASMLNRSLFEDTLIAHWASANPDEALSLYEPARVRELGKWRVSLERHGREVPPHIPEVPEAERRNLFRQTGTWIGLSIWELIASVEAQWSDDVDRTIMRQLHDFAHLFNTQALHQTPLSLELSVRTEGDTTTADVGASDIAIHNALMSAFWSYAQLISLYLTDEPAGQLSRLFARRWLHAFSEAGRLHRDERPSPDRP